ncbi:VPDSG-CTERM sorting domain-containing protein [Oleiharenicola lentus]|jgi:hypothetical protein|uniref:VPDSG-CTERM sorting domain-containing protein n=1 Tax=Oleiharenicola lentus TaxID=2508720 RepID=A0A4Q1C9U7_9BACT|nr:VPDSG-CTERM sorting domain-containing protein [Oleiharenicola lentus]RXK55813.1 VPDSG-CTERM sorting domain-containing protein [Oleiharenicola lentus]
MKNSLTHAFLILATAAVAFANPYGTNITISDKNYSGSGWYSNREDQETETNPNTITSQAWDLEGMFLHGQTLTLVGGYDFKNGVLANNKVYRSGDIFVDINGDAKYGQSANGSSGKNGTVANSFGWDYVLDLNFTTMTYNVIALTAQSLVNRGTDVASSNPWTYQSGGTAVNGYQGLAMSYTPNLTNAFTGFLGDSSNTTSWSTGTNDKHYALSVDLAYFAGQDAMFHYTMECGNDNLMGQAHVPDSGSTSLMIGVGLLALVGARRKLIR